MSKNLFETYDVNGETYTDNLGENALIGIPKKQFIEYEQQKEKIERLNNIINELEKYILAILNTPEFDIIQKDLILMIKNKLQELKGSDKQWK